MNKKNNRGNGLIWIALIIIFCYVIFSGNDSDKTKKDKNTFTIIASTSTSSMDDELIKYGKKNGINVQIEHYGDLEIVDILNSNSALFNRKRSCIIKVAMWFDLEVYN